MVAWTVEKWETKSADWKVHTTVYKRVALLAVLRVEMTVTLRVWKMVVHSVATTVVLMASTEADKTAAEKVVM